jgi:uncharacterized protein
MAGGVVLLSTMTFFLPFNVVVPLHGVVQLVSNSSRCFFLRQHIHKKMTLFFAFGAPLGTWFGVLVLRGLKNNNALLYLLAFLIIYVLFRPKKLPALNIPIKGFFFVGITAGMMAMLIGVTGPLMASFFLREDLTKEEIVATKGATQMISHLSKIVGFISLAFPFIEYWPALTALCCASLIGTKVGVGLLGRVNNDLFKLLYRSALFLALLKILYKILRPLLIPYL